ncbi:MULTISPECIES: tripartite tricarboxylate transporter substrate binding protein [unclassified Mesorhizobium]|uniref:Bug family tripartite tricarboxylate transporter substrate binding protein n=1 Tax=unclassified Mesorhizobium TaxID=325217 RepID=UPI0015E33E2B|nr:MULTISPECIES: tripartite tricarboxylate transporter substrate binding protein [unclassified Mesorhizobium]MBZ9894371.1 tripartite tricarboxylate transporter substrate binding protein [Mesorhizobium sp. BR1-1-6]
MVSKFHSLIRFAAAVAITVSAGLAATSAVRSEDYPNRDITFIVPFNPGGGTDPISRFYCAELEKVLNVNINVINKPGGSGSIGIGQIVKSPADGYTIGIATNSALAYQPFINDGLAWKSPDDYQPIIKLDDLPAILAVRADAPWKTFEDFMADVKKNPGKIRLSNSGVGTLPDLLIQQLDKNAGTRIASVPFTGGSGEAMVALLGGRVEGYIGYGAAVVGQLNAGKVKILAHFQKGKLEYFPEAESVIDAGYDVSLRTANYVVAPKGLPDDVKNKLAEASKQVVMSDAFLDFLKKQGFLRDAKGPDEVKAELVQYGKDFSDLIQFIGKE